MGGSVSQGWCHFGFYNTINIVLSDADTLRIQELIGTNSFDLDPFTGKPVPFKAYIKAVRYLPKTPGYQLVEIGLPDRNGAAVFEILRDHDIITGISPSEEFMREQEFVQMSELKELKDLITEFRQKDEDGELEADELFGRIMDYGKKPKKAKTIKITLDE